MEIFSYLQYYRKKYACLPWLDDGDHTYNQFHRYKTHFESRILILSCAFDCTDIKEIVSKYDIYGEKNVYKKCAPH